MQRTLHAPRAIRRRALSYAPRPFSTSAMQRGLFTKDQDGPLDPSKQATDVNQNQAKDPEGPNPAEQQAKIVKQQGHGQTQEEGRASQRGGGSAGDGSTQQSGLAEKSPGEKSGEAAVNPAVKKS